MTYSSAIAEAGRRPIITATIDLDKCANDFGVSPCVAAAATGLKCFNTFGTCQDTGNYDNSSTLSLTFTGARDDILPAPAASPGDIYIPCIDSISTAPEKITPGKGIGQRGSVTITCLDFPHSDLGVDPYVSERSYIPVDQGTFFGKLLARNPHYVGRTVTIRQYFEGEGRTASDTRESVYILDRIEGPDARGLVKITAKDPISLAEGSKAQCPAPTSGTLSAALIAATTSTFDVNSGEGDEYPTGAHVVRINDELIAITSRSSDTFTIASRGYGGTTAADHSTDDSLQLCYEADGTSASRVDLVLADLIENYAGVPAAYIPTTEWDAEADTWANGYNLETIISEPTSVAQLLTEICIETNSVIWWSPTDQEIKWQTQTPNFDAIDAIEDKDMLDSSSGMSIKQTDRVSKVLFYCNVRNWTEGLEATNYHSLQVRIDSTGESSDAYDSAAVKKIFGRWQQSPANAGEVASRYLSRFKHPPELLKAELDLKDIERIPVGDHVLLCTDMLQNIFGAAGSMEMQILSARHTPGKETVAIEAMRFRYDTERYCNVGANSLGNYTTESEAIQAVYGFIADTSTVQMSNGDDPYLIT